MAQEHDNVETASDSPAVVTGDQTDGLPQALAEGEGSIRVASEADVEAAAEVLGPAASFIGTDPEMALGGMRDHIINAAKRTPVWKGLDERGKTNFANEIEQACRQSLKGGMTFMADMGFDSIAVTIKDPGLKTEKDQIEAKIVMDDDEEAWMKVRKRRSWVLVFADAEELMGARAAFIEKDQPGLFDSPETPEQRAEREKAAEAAEQARLLANFKPTDNVEPAAALEPDKMSPSLRAAYDRGAARRAAGGARTLPEDLMDKDMAGDSAAPNAWFAGYDADPAEDAPAAEAAAEPAKKPKRRGRKSVDEAVAERQASLAGADARGTYEPA